MGSRPSKDHSIDRRNNDKGYHKSNCRWTDWKTQCRNKRNNHVLKFEGESMTMAEAIERSGTGINPGVVHYRLAKGWSAEKAIYTTVNSMSRV